MKDRRGDENKWEDECEMLFRPNILPKCLLPIKE
jgi:hypothetical protein